MIKYKSPSIGKKSRELIKRDKKVMFGAHTRTREIPLAVKKAQGVWIEDLDGKKYLDFGAGYAVVATGHCHPDIIRAAEKQMKTLIHISGSDFYYWPQVLLAEKLVSLVPGKFKKRVYFSNSGAESLEAAFKLTRHFTRRSVVISFFGAFHGRTFVGMSLSGSKAVQRAHFYPLIPQVIHTLYPYCYRCPLNLSYPDCKKGQPKINGVVLLPCVGFLTNTIFKRLVEPDDVAAIFVEPIQGEGGYIVPPPEFLPLLRKITEKYGIVLVVDEIQAGFGRTGKMFAFQHWNIIPDVICVAKAIASGFPLGATIAREEMMDAEIDERAWRVGSHGSTFGGNPVACAVALKTIELIEKQLMKNAEDVGNYMIESLKEMKERHRIIGDVRGKGLMIGVEFVKDKNTKEMFPEKLTEDGKNIKQIIMGEAFKRGLIILGCGWNAVRFSPPLTISKNEAEHGLTIFEEVVSWVEKQLK